MQAAPEVRGEASLHHRIREFPELRHSFRRILEDAAALQHLCEDKPDFVAQNLIHRLGGIS